MRRISHSLLLVSFLLFSCTSTTQPLQTSLVVYRFDTSSFLEFSEDFQLTKEIPYSVPFNCTLFNTFPAPVGQFLLIELSCPNGQTVLLMDLESASTSQPVTDSDSHFLAWTSDGKSAYLKVDSLGSPQIIRASTNGKKEIIEIPEFTYDLATKPDSPDFIFAFSRGFGYGSELHLAQLDGKTTKLLYADQTNYISYARYSPDGNQITFLKIPDTQTPFTVGELWLMDSDGSNAHKLADADAGHGYAANWSPDGKRIAFVVRENPDDETANTSSDALISNIYVVDVGTGAMTQITNFTEGRAETPLWLPGGNTLAFNVVINGRMQVHIADIGAGGVVTPNPVSVEIKDLESAITCCPAWMRK